MAVHSNNLRVNHNLFLHIVYGLCLFIRDEHFMQVGLNSPKFFSIFPSKISTYFLGYEMHMHAIQQLFFEDLSSEKLQCRNSTLNLRWVINKKTNS